ncbi:hypothetical protein ACHAW5_003213 [Stephanodiscus triporus]|uniref:Uncharacterized protein n=1 Tax=Stephanodiscus triporus TaxID=2934178 RepID=A0ABD3N756_9STRA
MDSQENPFEGMSKDDINNDGNIHYDGVRDVVEELTDPSMPTLPPLPGDNVDVDLEDGSDGDGDDYENDVNENSSSPYFSSTEPTTAAASMAATATLSTTTATTTATTTSKKAVTRSYKSTLQFRTDLTKSSRDVHPCGILHFTRIGGGGHGHGDGNSHGGVGAGSYPSSSSPSPSEEHAFAWISRYHDDACLSNALLHMSKFGFDPNDVVFIPYSSRRSWIDRYPLAFPHVFCGENGIVTGYPHWSDGAGWAGWEVVNLRRTSFAVTGGGDGVALTGANPSLSSPSVETTTAIATSLSTSTTRGGARRKKKIFPTAHLSNDERDELHIEIYRYFKWLRDSLLQSSSLSSAVQQAAISSSDGGGGTAPTADGINDDCAGDQSKQSSSIVVGGGGGSTAGGIKLLSLDNLMEEMKSTFKVVRNYQINASSSSSTTPDGMPFLEEAIGEPLGRLAALARHDHPDRRNPSCDNNRRSGGLDFDDMYGRLERFKREHGHVNVPQKYAQDGGIRQN